jgi:hypothetical protein
MKTLSFIAALGAALAASPLAAANKPFQGFGFEAWVQRADGSQYREHSESGQPHLKVRPGEEYSIVVRNPLPVRAAVAVSIDGLNSIDGSRSTPRQARKWIVDPHGSITITGWQISNENNRKFVFTQDSGSYAQWREGREGKPYTRNLGVIGIAWSWNREELERALHPPQPFKDELSMRKSERPSAAPAAAASAEGRAGTGMGEEESNHVTSVEFQADAGMFNLRDVLSLYYEFAPEPPVPQPFVGEDEEGQRFAPAMPR